MTNIQFVPDINKNLVSLGVLVGKDIQISLANSYLKTTKGALVVMKCIKKRIFSIYKVAQLLVEL